MAKIEIDIDRYGNLARASCLADYLELLALAGHSCTRAELADVVSDRWGMRRQITLMPYESESEEDGETYSESAWSALLERNEALGELYPFEFTSTRLELKEGFDVRNSPYIGLLCVTAAHAYGVQTPRNVELLFEELVALGLEALGLKVARFGAITRDNGYNFPASITALGEILGIPTDAKRASRHARANDSGLDVLAHLDWLDGRNGRWLFLGQVTCAASQRWAAKVSEVKVQRWQLFLNELVAPTVFLAVPHHVDKRAYYEVVEGDGKPIVDRTRLAKSIVAINSDTAEVIDAVLATDLETFQVA